MPPVTYRRAHHVITEIQRTQTGAQAIEDNNYEEFGRLMYESHDSLRYYFEVSCDELDRLVELARSVDGVLGSRMTGAGFGKKRTLVNFFYSLSCLFIYLGGCTVTLLKKSSLENCIETIKNNYKGQPSFYEFKPCDGARSINFNQSNAQ